ncbi:MAG: beta-N-acetylhexosaminidase [Bacillota bacterium]|nr:beta-N-acetylhexosaminidase [Bacillota bacterium]
MKSAKEMTLKEKIGQLFFFGFPGNELSPEIIALIEEYKLGNIILFARNIKTPRQLYELNKEIHDRISRATGIMPLIAIDQEGGMVTRIMNGVTFPPGNMTMAATDREMAYRVGKIVGEELRALGINMNLAPVLDVNNNPDNPVIGVRSFSDDPETVARFGLEYIRGLQGAGIIATGKHFPGHGDTALDSHYALPVIGHDKDRLDRVELYPFRRAIENNIDAIMSAHVIFPAYENGELPATLSEKVLTGLLRGELGFGGLIVSDCMEMKAIDDHFTAPRGALAGLLAGLDMVFISHAPEKQRAALELLTATVESGEFPLSLLDEKAERILRYKEKIYPTIKEHFYNRDYDAATAVLTSPEHRNTAAAVVDASLTKVKGKDFRPVGKTLVIAPDPRAVTIAEDKVAALSITDAVRHSGLPYDVVKIERNIASDTIDEIVSRARDYQTVVICTWNAASTGQAELARKLYRACADLYVISTRNPYDIFAFPEIDNYLCLYEYTPNSVATLLKYLKGEIYPSGKLPVRLWRPPKIGASLYVGLPDYALEKNIEYLRLLKRHGIDRIFISGHMPEMKAGFEGELREIVSVANDLGMKVILDISPAAFSKITLPPIYALRLDYGFSREEIVRLANEADYRIELNASTISEEDLRYLLNRGTRPERLRISHNFYPKPYTGLSHEEVLKKNLAFRKYGFKVAAFIPSQVNKRPPLYEGLPTVEDHRRMPLLAALSEVAGLELDEIYFGDAYVGEDELAAALAYDGKTVYVPLALYPGITDNEKAMLLREHRNRLDATPYFIRSSVRSRDAAIKPRNTVARGLCEVTVDNELFGRYQGEVAIMMSDLPADRRVNVVGKAIVTDFAINEIKKGKKFKFILTGENS